MLKTLDGKVTNYAYDAAGRLVKDGDKMYSYGWLDKIVNVQENGTMVAAFDYHINGQIASATYADKTENFLWDGLALIHRGDNSFVNEPYVTGGNPILSSKDGVMFNDMLGTTLGVKSGEQVNQVNMTAFGEPLRPAANGDAAKSQDAFFTGKPHIGELGYAFLFRNYRPEQGKWQTADPLGYPDGWNNLAYVNNGVTSDIDWLGASILSTTVPIYSNELFGTLSAVFNDSYNNPSISGANFSITGSAYVWDIGGTFFKIGLATKLWASNLACELTGTSVNEGTLGGKPTKFITYTFTVSWIIEGEWTILGVTKHNQSATQYSTVSLTAMVQE